MSSRPTLSRTVIPAGGRPPFDALRSRVSGTVAEPGDPAYGALATPWNLAVEMRPAAVVAPRSTVDVAATVNFARAHGSTVGVQATGHGARSPMAGHVLLATRHLDEVTVHPDQRWVRVGAGVRWRRVIEATTPYGLAPLSGSSGDVGVVGYTTGGGVGPMARTFGLASDRVRAFDVVTGDGVLRRATPDEHPDLFFALRGGKGVGGIVTAVEFDLVPLPSFTGGALYFAGDDAGAVVTRWRAWSATLPEQATTSFAILQVPPGAAAPPPLVGRMAVSVRFVWVGRPRDGARLVDEMRATAPVLVDDVAVRSYAEIDAVHADPVDPMPARDPAMLLTGLPDEAAGRLLAGAGPGSGSPQIVVEVRQLGGAYAREAARPDAFSHRRAAFSLLAVGAAPDPRVEPHGRELLGALADWDTGGAWPNLQPPHDVPSARRAYAPSTLAALAAVAEHYDPFDVFPVDAVARQAAGLSAGA